MRILLADDHALFRDGLASLLGAWGHDVVGQASTGAEAAALADRTQPDLVLMDVRMPGGSGIEATARIKATCPSTAIVMVTVSEDEDDLFAAIKAGAQGYLLKNLEAAQLRSMIDAVGRGEAAISPATAARIIEEFVRRERLPDTPVADPDRLTERELEVLALVTQGLRNKEIAAELGISENTAKYHLRNILGQAPRPEPDRGRGARRPRGPGPAARRAAVRLNHGGRPGRDACASFRSARARWPPGPYPVDDSSPARPRLADVATRGDAAPNNRIGVGNGLPDRGRSRRLLQLRRVHGRLPGRRPST